MDLITIIGFTAAALTSLAGIPQFIKTVHTRETKSLSLYTYIILVVGISLWIVYAVSRKDIPLILSNVAVIVPTVIILLIKIKNG